MYKLIKILANFIFTSFQYSMNIQSIPQQQPTFTARNNELKNADKIMRNLMHEYPAFSTSRAKYYEIYTKKPQTRMKLLMPIYWKLCAARNELKKYEDTSLLDKTLEMVKEEKNANCAEFAQMARAAFIANGYKDVKIGSLRIHFPKEDSFLPPLVASKRADHNVLIVNAGKNAKLDDPKTISKKAFVVDPWGGFCDYVANAFNKYKGIFLRNLPPEEQTAPKKFIFAEVKPLNVTETTCSTMAEKHPELVVKNK